MLDIEIPLFQPFPSEIVFQNYEPFETYTVPLNLRNNDKVSFGKATFTFFKHLAFSLGKGDFFIILC